MIRRFDRITTWVILLIAVLYTLEALRFPGGAKIVPSIFGGLAIVVVLVQLLSPRIKAFRTLSGELSVTDTRDLDVFRDPAARRRLVLISVSLLAVPLLVAVFGLPLALPLYVAGLLLIQRQSLLVVIACTAIISAMSYGLLIELLAWPWDDGVLWSFMN
jgi:hypothetical protein